MVLARRLWSLQNFNLTVVMHVVGDLGEIAHVEPLRTDQAFLECSISH
jgi:hypothetical protein